MRRHLDPEDPTTSSPASDPEVARFAEDLHAAFPEQPAPQAIAGQHVAAMMEAVEQTALGAAARPSTPRRRTMRHRITVRIAAVATGLLLSMGGVALAGAFSGSDDEPDDQPAAVVSDLDENGGLDDAVEVEDADDQGENEDADDQGENEDADDQGENEDADDQGGVADESPEAEGADDDQGEDADDQGEDADDQGETEDEGDANDDQQNQDADDADEDGSGSED